MTTARDVLKSIDALMDEASEALAKTAYFEAESLCLKAMARARREVDFERMGRICLPLQESRRQRRHEACDAGAVHVIRGLPPRGVSAGPLESGLYLVEPPMVGVEGRTVRALVFRRQLPAMVLVREPTTQAGMWPMVAVGEIGAGLNVPPALGQREPMVVRVKVKPPARDDGLPDAAWFLAAQEALGDAAIAKVKPDQPADHRVDDLLELLDAVPDHEKLSQALQSACQDASKEGVSALVRRRPVVVDPFSF